MVGAWDSSFVMPMRSVLEAWGSQHSTLNLSGHVEIASTPQGDVRPLTAQWRWLQGVGSWSPRITHQRTNTAERKQATRGRNFETIAPSPVVVVFLHQTANVDLDDELLGSSSVGIQFSMVRCGCRPIFMHQCLSDLQEQRCLVIVGHFDLGTLIFLQQGEH